jgi:hypothetical protein
MADKRGKRTAGHMIERKIESSFLIQESRKLSGYPPPAALFNAL